MPYTKRCQESASPCQKSGGKCAHPWHITVMHKGTRLRGPIADFMHLLPPGTPFLPASTELAKRAEAAALEWLIAGCPPTSKDGVGATGSPTVATAATAYLNTYVKTELHRSKGTDSMMKRIIAELGERPLTDLLSVSVVKTFKSDMAETSEGTANAYLRRLSHFINWCRPEFGLTGPGPMFHQVDNPMGVKKFTDGPGRARRLQPEEEAALIAHFTAQSDGLMLGRFYGALDGCLRRGEMLKMKSKDIDWSGPVPQMRLKWTTTKSDKARDIPVATKRLRAFLESRKRFTHPFGDAAGNLITDFRTEWDNALEQTGLESWVYDNVQRQYKKADGGDADLHWHDLRHEGASRLAERNVPVPIIQKLLGHADLNTTLRYLNMTDAGVTAAVVLAQEGL
jgi:integrase